MRKTKNLKQDVLAKEIDISQQNLSRYENEQRIISFDTIEKISNTCDYEIYFIHSKTKEKFKIHRPPSKKFYPLYRNIWRQTL